MLAIKDTIKGYEMENSVINFNDIKKILPHRYPFLLIDRVLFRDENSIRALKNVSANEPFFNGHFPEFAIMPGVLQIEAMAQAAGIILLKDGKERSRDDLAVLASIESAKFKRMVTPGDQLILEATITNKKAGFVKADARALVDDKVVSMATIVLMQKPR